MKYNSILSVLKNTINQAIFATFTIMSFSSTNVIGTSLVISLVFRTMDELFPEFVELLVLLCFLLPLGSISGSIDNSNAPG